MIYSSKKKNADQYNISKAIYYYQLAADQNHPKSQINLGMIYIQLGNVKKGIHYLKLAAEQRIVAAQFNLGVL